MYIVLFGGSFNPPHLGHQIIISQAFELIPNINELWLLPDYQHTFAKNADLAPAHHRLKMTKMLKDNNVKTETCLIDQKMSGQTIDAVTFLQKKYPQHQFSFLMGSDQLTTFNQWGNWRQLLKLLPFYIYPRPGFTFKPIRNNMRPLKSKTQIITNLSSTLIRDRLKNKLPVNHLLPAKVKNYINQNNLYLPVL